MINIIVPLVLTTFIFQQSGEKTCAVATVNMTLGRDVYKKGHFNEISEILLKLKEKYESNIVSTGQFYFLF